MPYNALVSMWLMLSGPAGQSNGLRPEACAAVTESVAPSGRVLNTRWITNLDAVAGMSDDEIPTHRLSIRDAVVDAVAAGGFWLAAGHSGCRWFVVPAEGSLIRVTAGESIDLQGEFRRATTGQRLDDGVNVFVYAYIVRKVPAGP